MARLWEALDDLEKKKKSRSAELDELKESKTVYSEVMNDIDDQLEAWEALRDDIEAGKAVYPPKLSQSKKRKARDDRRPRKKQRRSSPSTDHEDSTSDSEASTSSEAEIEADEDAFRGDPLTEEQASTKIAELRSAKKESRRSKTDIDDKIKEVRKSLDVAVTTIEEIEAKIATACISGRNQYSKGAIQHDYAAGIKELDQELAAEEDEEAFNPEEEIRDYEEVARSLPVFCVSSRAFQKLQGRLRKDGPVPGFQNVDETEIPMLQQHASQLTIAGRTANCKRFLNNLSQLLNSLTLWASSDGTGGHLSKEQQVKEERHLASSLKKLESVS